MLAVVVLGGVGAVWAGLVDLDPSTTLTAAGDGSEATNSGTGQASSIAAVTAAGRSPSTGASSGEVVVEVDSGVAHVSVDTCATGEVTASGFLVAPDLVVTAAGVVQDAADIRVSGEFGTRQVADVDVDTATGVALLQVAEPAAGHVFAMSSEASAVDDDVTFLGRLVPTSITEIQGSVVETESMIDGADGAVDVVMVDQVLPLEMVGGPLVEDTKVVGMAVANPGITTQTAAVAGPVLEDVVANGVDGVISIPSACSGGTTTTPSPTRTPSPDDQPFTPSWIVIFESLEVDEYTAGDAVARSVPYQEELRLMTRILHSSDYGSLNPGYRVIYTGPYGSEEQARAACNAVYDQVDNCYHRFLDR